jgi:hypothetical protein
MIVIQPENPYSREEILSCLAILQKEVDHFFHKVPPNLFFSHSLGGWSVGENFSHLTFTTNMLALGFKIPKIFFRILYGKPLEESTFLECKSTFFDKLKIPQDAGIYAPAIENSPRDPSHKIIILIREWNNACINLVSSLEMITETELSDYRIQHPLMGRVSFREICFLHILHILHHTSKIETKLKNASRTLESI